MTLRARSMEPKDIQECAQLVTSHPVIGPRYGRAAHQLRQAWRKLLGSEAMVTAVYEDVNGAAIKICGVGVGLFVRDDFMHEVKTPPLFWFGPELASRIHSERSPVLSDREVREENSTKGLNLIVWEAVPRPEFAEQPEMYHLMVDAFRQGYRGFLLKEMITSQADSVRRAQWGVNAGGFFWDSVRARYVNSIGRNLAGFVRKPHIVGITRELGYARVGSWVGSLFDYQPPRFGFSRSEQRLLQTTLAGGSGTDEQLMKSLGVALPTIKKMWISIYRRVIDCQPETIRDSARGDEAERGKEKRRLLLTYLREHPEELRPVSRSFGRQPSVIKQIKRSRP